MSATLKWRPVDKGDSLPVTLRFAIEKRMSFPVRLGYNDRGYVQGLMDAGIGGAEELLELIDQHGEIELFCVY